MFSVIRLFEKRRITAAYMYLLPFLKFSQCPHANLCLCVSAELRQWTGLGEEAEK